jgi:hypothetical protein
VRGGERRAEHFGVSLRCENVLSLNEGGRLPLLCNKASESKVSGRCPCHLASVPLRPHQSRSNSRKGVLHTVGTFKGVVAPILHLLGCSRHSISNK